MVRTIRGRLFRVAESAQFFSIPVHQYDLNGGLDIAMTTSIFPNKSIVRTAEIRVSDPHATYRSTTFVVYYYEDDALEVYNEGTFDIGAPGWKGEIFVIRTDVLSKRYVNMRKHDEDLMAKVVRNQTFAQANMSSINSVMIPDNIIWTDISAREVLLTKDPPVMVSALVHLVATQ
ncbi:hypothetical protein BKA93DRAFT_749681 [Sparassis latifolia]